MFYDNFCAICKEKGLKPTNVVNELGLSSGNMTNWKNGRTPKTEVINKIANFLNVSIDELLGNAEKKAVVNDEDIKFALFGGDGEITDEMYNDVKKFAQFIKEKYQNDKKE